MARDDRRDAPHNGVHGAHKSYKERKGTKYIHSDPASPPDVPGLLHTTSLGRTGCGALLVSPRGRFILGGAFRLYVLRDKSAVRAGTADLSRSTYRRNAPPRRRKTVVEE